MLRDFGGKKFHCEMSRDLEVTNDSARCWEKQFYMLKQFSLDCRKGLVLVLVLVLLRPLVG